MKQIHFWLPALLLSVLLCASCVSTHRVEQEIVCTTNDDIVDTLFLNFTDMEDELCEISIRRNDLEFSGREIVTNGQVWFDIRNFPAGRYAVWIKIGGKFIRKTFNKI